VIDREEGVVHADRINLLHGATQAHKAGRYAEAERYYLQMLGINPEDFDAVHRLGILKLHQGLSEEAQAFLERAVAIEPESAPALSNLGAALMATGECEEALARYEAAAALQPHDIDYEFNICSALLQLDRYSEALARIEPLLARQPGDVEIIVTHAVLLHKLQRFEDALQRYNQILDVAPDRADIYNNRGNIFSRLRRLDEALVNFERASQLAPTDAAIEINRAKALLELMRFDEALSAADRALALAPKNPDCHHRRGKILWELDRREEAIRSYEAAHAEAPDHLSNLLDWGAALLISRKYRQAITVYQLALEQQPDHSEALAQTVGLAAHICDWPLASRIAERLRAKIETGSFNGTPFPALAAFDDPLLQRQAAEGYARNVITSAPRSPSVVRRSQKLRIGYLSADFRIHPVAFLTLGLIERHDRAFCEVSGFTVHAEAYNPLQKRVMAAFDRIVNVDKKTDAELCSIIRDAEIDILVDLGGYTLDSRMMALALRPAPIQLSYIGYPGTSGAPFIDYILADRFIIPEGSDDLYTEKIVYLPDCFQANDDRRLIGLFSTSRTHWGLPENGIVFCAFHNSYKIKPASFDIWMRLLSKVPGSVLWLTAEGVARENLCREAQARDIDPARLIFATHTNYPDHLARQRLADLFLDAWPYNGGTTASDALWVGLPVLTCSGRSYAARMAGSLLHAVGLPEMVAYSPEEYEVLALRLATEPGFLAGLRRKLAGNIKTTALFDTDRFRKHVEIAYGRMWERHLRGEPPTGFSVDSVYSQVPDRPAR